MTDIRPTDSRKPRSVYGVGQEPDPRFTLANERTALAWVRTGLSLIAGGVGLISLSAIVNLPVLLDIVAMVACLSGGALAMYSMVAWRAAERALRTGAPLPASRALVALAVGVGAMALVLTGYAVITMVQ